MPLPLYASMRLLPKDYTPRNADVLLTCIGRYEQFYNVEVTRAFCDTAVKFSWQWFVCNSMQLLAVAIMSNCFEMYFLWKCIQVTNAHTKDVKNLLSLSTYKKRQRYSVLYVSMIISNITNVSFREDGVMFSVSFWQWVLEVLLVLLMTLHLYYLAGKSRFFDKFFNVIGTFYYHVINAFYLFGDREFQRGVTQNGILTSVRKAIFQSYTWTQT